MTTNHNEIVSVLNDLYGHEWGGVGKDYCKYYSEEFKEAVAEAIACVKREGEAMGEISEIVEILATQIHHSECRFHSKFITEKEHQKELKAFTEQAEKTLTPIIAKKNLEISKLNEEIAKWKAILHRQAVCDHNLQVALEGENAELRKAIEETNKNHAVIEQGLYSQIAELRKRLGNLPSEEEIILILKQFSDYYGMSDGNVRKVAKAIHERVHNDTKKRDNG